MCNFCLNWDWVLRYCLTFIRMLPFAVCHTKFLSVWFNWYLIIFNILSIVCLLLILWKKNWFKKEMCFAFCLILIFFNIWTYRTFQYPLVGVGSPVLLLESGTLIRVLGQGVRYSYWSPVLLLILAYFGSPVLLLWWYSY